MRLGQCILHCHLQKSSTQFPALSAGNPQSAAWWIRIAGGDRNRRLPFSVNLDAFPQQSSGVEHALRQSGGEGGIRTLGRAL